MSEAIEWEPSEEFADFEDTQLEEEVAEKVFSIDSLIRARHGEARPLSDIEDGLNHAIIGQSEAIESLMVALNREKLRNPNRPISTLFFLGPTGVGKSETAKELAQLLHPEGGGFLKINCETYKYGHNIASLIGSPPGYVGREQKAYFDSPELKKKRCVILFDEIEKGGPEIRDLQLQIIEDGELTLPGNGKTVSFKDSIIIMTSNLGAKEIGTLLDKNGLGFQHGNNAQVDIKDIEREARKALEREFRPEYINRFDRRVVFKNLNDEELGAVLERYVEKVNKNYMAQAGISLTLTPEVRDALVQSTDERRKYGARPILRKYEQLVENLLGEYVNSEGIPHGSRVYTTFSDDAPEGASLEERIDLLYAPDESLLPKKSKALVKRKHGSAKQEESEDTEPLFRQKIALSAAAAVGLAAIFVGDYMNSRKRYRSY